MSERANDGISIHNTFEVLDCDLSQRKKARVKSKEHEKNDQLVHSYAYLARFKEK
jgi:hypothetical protein